MFPVERWDERPEHFCNFGDSSHIGRTVSEFFYVSENGFLYPVLIGVPKDVHQEKFPIFFFYC